MTHKNHMGFIYGGPIPDFLCQVCGKLLVSSDGTEINPGRTMYKDWEEESYGLSGPFNLKKRKTAVVCPECQRTMEDEGFYLAMWWSKDGMIHGTK